MELRLTLALPHDASSVPVARRLLASSLQSLGVTPDDIGDIEVALTEACTNVLAHVTETSDYQVSAAILGSWCTITIKDRGTGFDSEGRGRDDADSEAEGGRGIQLMRALVDKVTFVNHENDGTLVHLEKELSWDSGAPGARPLAGERPETAHPSQSDPPR